MTDPTDSIKALVRDVATYLRFLKEQRLECPAPAVAGVVEQASASRSPASKPASASRSPDSKPASAATGPAAPPVTAQFDSLFDAARHVLPSSERRIASRLARLAAASQRLQIATRSMGRDSPRSTCHQGLAARPV